MWLSLTNIFAVSMYPNLKNNFYFWPLISRFNLNSHWYISRMATKALIQSVFAQQKQISKNNSLIHPATSASRLIQGYLWKIILGNILGSRSRNPSKYLNNCSATILSVLFKFHIFFVSISSESFNVIWWLISDKILNLLISNDSKCNRFSSNTLCRDQIRFLVKFG